MESGMFFARPRPEKKVRTVNSAERTIMGTYSTLKAMLPAGLRSHPVTLRSRLPSSHSTMNHEALDETLAMTKPLTINDEALDDTPARRLPSTKDDEAFDETLARRLPSTKDDDAFDENPATGLHPTRNYEALYETQARTLAATVSIGGGDYEEAGRRMLGVLLMEGLEPDYTVVDFGCGTGRLAVHAIPWLKPGGRYIGIDISTTMLAHAKKLIDEKVPSPLCTVEFLHQTTPSFSLPDKTVDMLCAFSVFTHMEHEDSFRYLRSARRTIKDDGQLIYSCLTLDLAMSREDFLQQASLDVVERWAVVRNVTTSREMMDTIAGMAGWKTVRWYQGDQRNIQLPNSSEMRALGQSICVLAPA